MKSSLPKTLPGSVHGQYVRCGKQTCKCTRGKLHGPYFYHYARAHRTLVKRYVKVEDLPQLRAMCDARRQEDSRHRLANKLNARQLSKALEQLRDNEKFLASILRG